MGCRVLKPGETTLGGQAGEQEYWVQSETSYFSVTLDESFLANLENGSLL